MTSPDMDDEAMTTNNTDGAALLPVTAEDRTAYCDYEDLDGKYRERVMSGAWDNVAGVQAFARHRKDHSLPGDVGMREALEGLSLAADEINGDIDLQVNGDHSEEVDVNGEYYVTLSAAKVDALNKAICVAQRLLKKVPARPANPTVEKILTLAKRKYHFQPTIGAVLRSHMPTGTTGHDWDDKEAFSQAIAILDLIPDLAALSSPLPATQEDAERSVAGVIEPQYLIRKNGAYYRPKAAGYTTCIAEAGRYSLTEAIKHSHPNGPNGPRDGITYEPAPATPQRQEYDGEAVREALERAQEIFEQIGIIASGCATTHGDPGGGLEMIAGYASDGFAALSAAPAQPVDETERLRRALDGVDCISRLRDDLGGKIELTWLEPERSWPLFNLLSEINSGRAALSTDKKGGHLLDGREYLARPALTDTKGDRPMGDM